MTLRRTDAAMSRQVDDVVIVLHVTSGEYFELDPVGSLVWEGLEQPATIEDLTAAVCAEYDVDADTASRDVQDLVGDMITAGLVVGDT